MISPLIAEETRLKLVAGVHRTRSMNVGLSVGRVLVSSGATPMAEIAFGFMDSPSSQMARPDDLRELAELFAKMADALEQT